MKSAPAISFDYRPSRWLLAAIVSVIVLAGISILICGLPLAIKIAVMALVASYSGYVLRRVTLVEHSHIAWQAEGHWRVTDARGEQFPAQLTHVTVIGATITLILQIVPRRKLVLLLLPDNISAETRRLLRVRLSRRRAIGIEDAATR